MKHRAKPSGDTRRAKLPDDYRQLKTKVFVRAFGMVFAAGAIIWVLFSFVLRGNIANWTIAVMEHVLRIDYDSAWQLYARIFRRNADVLMFAGAIVVFLVIFRVYLNWFTGYFVQINHGIDALIEEDAGAVVLSPELAAIEHKINAIQHTLQKRKLDAQFAEQQKNDLIVYLAHDLKTPLTTVIGYLTLLRDAPEMTTELRAKYAGIALGKAERLETLINEFFDITRFSLTQMTLDEEVINLTRMLEQIAHELQPILSDMSLSLDLQLAPDVQIRCDPDKLRRVFDNLLRNAMNYSHPGTPIEISLALDEGQTDVDQPDTARPGTVVVRVTNRGKPIPPQKLEQIFEQFHRLDTARSATTGGAGLGLAIAKEIVTRHGGTIAARSENDVIIFTVTLPGSRQKIV